MNPLELPVYASIYEKTQKTNSKGAGAYNTPDVMSGVTSVGNSDLRELDGSEDLMVDIEIRPNGSPFNNGKENSQHNRSNNWNLPLKSPDVTQATLNRGIRNFERSKGLTPPKPDVHNKPIRSKSRNKKKSSSKGKRGNYVIQKRMRSVNQSISIN